MGLRWCSDVSPGDWLAASGTPEWQLITFGPAGFADYARLRFIPDPVHSEQSENEVARDDLPESETALIRGVLDVLAPHTATPDDCYFCLWDGWATDLYGGDGLRIADFATGTVTRGPTLAPAFDDAVLQGPKVSIPIRSIPIRDYFLFRGSLSDFGDWGAADYLPGMPRTNMPNPGFIWPADHAWCVASDVDPHWAGIGAPVAAIDELMAAPGLDIVRADPTQRQPRYR